MKIVVITGSGRARGSSCYLAERFIAGAVDSGNEVYRFDAGLEEVRPCRGCGTCRSTGCCVIKDSYSKLVPKILEADEIVWATPIYYMTMTASLKIIIDRFYQMEISPRFWGKKKYVVLATAWDRDPKVFDILMDTFMAFCKFLKWEKEGEVLAAGIESRSQIINSNYGNMAYELGKIQMSRIVHE